MSWVGFELLHRSHKIGLSERRSRWFQKWTREIANSGYVHMSKFEEGLGRMMYVARASEYERPFLSPLCRFLTLLPRDSVRKLPSYAIFILKYLADQVENRHYDCAGNLTTANHAQRVDAQASDERTGVGGWCPELGEDGSPDPSKSRWFSLEVTREDFLRVYCRGDKASRIIATLESLAVLLAFEAFYSSVPGRERTKNCSLHGLTTG